MNQDMLDRRPFIELLNQIITQKTAANEGFSFAIDGKWGCGKSWILKELERKLESQNHLVIHYNCWENEYYEEPLVALLSVIVDKLNQLEPTLQGKKIKQTIKATVKCFAMSANSIIKNNSGFDTIELITALKKEIKENQKEFSDKKFDPTQLIKITLENVRNKLLQLKKPLSAGGFAGIVIVVDELDRCLPEYAIKVMQRLHHICFNAESDKYTLIQLAAINKSELLGSIAKTFGREFNLTQKYTNPDKYNPGKITYDNFDESQSQFGNYYFKKFFQLIIPVSNGEQTKNPLSILDGFEEKFDSGDTNGRKYVERFFTEVLSFFPMRTKLELIHLVKTAHQITAMNSSLDLHLKYNTLCIELIDGLCKSILKKGLPLIKREELQNGYHELYLQISPLLSIDEISNFKDFEKSFAKWSASDCSEKSFGFGPRNQTTMYVFNISTPQAYIKRFYQSEEDLDIEITGADAIQSEIAFIEAFRKTLDTLV